MQNFHADYSKEKGKRSVIWWSNPVGGGGGVVDTELTGGSAVPFRV